MSPYASDKQRKYMYAVHPKIAKRWDKEAKAHKGATVQRKGKGK